MFALLGVIPAAAIAQGDGDLPFATDQAVPWPRSASSTNTAMNSPDATGAVSHGSLIDATDESVPWPRPAMEAHSVQAADPRNHIAGTSVDAARIIARVGPEVILAADILPQVDLLLLEQGQQLPPDQLEAQRLALTNRLLENLIQQKLIYADARRTIPKENFPKVEEQMLKHFEETEIPRLMEKFAAESRAELDGLLRKQGSTLDAYRKGFLERSLAYYWLREQTKVEEKIDEFELRRYYDEHKAEYDFPARARWEQISIHFHEVPDRDEARRMIEEMGDRFLIHGEPFAEVARNGSHGLHADRGGVHDWITQGSLVSEELDRHIFQLPVGAPSQIIEDDKGFHIVRVIEREEAGRKSFEEMQGEIRETTSSQRAEAAKEEYFARLERLFPVSTVFDESKSALDIARQREVATR